MIQAGNERAPSAEPTLHLQPCAELAERVLLPGDPGRAQLLAEDLLLQPAVFNRNRGLLGYTGRLRGDGEPLTIQTTGMGGPSAAIIVEELVRLGASRLIRVGTCGALVPALELRDLIVAERVLACDGTSRALGAGDAVLPDPALTEALSEVSNERGHSGAVVSTDLFYDEESGLARWVSSGAIGVEMEAATVLQLAARRGVQAACVLLVTDLLVPGRRRLARLEIVHESKRLGRVAAVALAQSSARKAEAR